MRLLGDASEKIDKLALSSFFVLVLGGYELVFSDSLRDVVVGLALGAMAILLMARWIWRRETWPKWLRITLTVMVLGPFGFFSFVRVKAAVEAPFILVFPGLAFSDNKTRAYYLAAKRKTLGNVVVMVLDDVDPSRSMGFRLTEVNARTSGVAEYFRFGPSNLGNEELTIIIQSRDGDTTQKLWVKTRGFALFPSLKTEVKSTDGRALFRCRSKDFPTKENWPDCGNDIFAAEP